MAPQTLTTSPLKTNTVDGLHANVYNPRMAKRKRARWDAKSVRALRKHLRMSQQELADELGVRQQTVSEWETGMYHPRGASGTLLNIIAERSDFTYATDEADDRSA